MSVQKTFYFGKQMWWIWIFCLLFAGCAKQEKGPKTLNISFNTHPATLDPRQAGDFASSTLICMVYEGLTRCLPGGSVENALADWTDISFDRKTYTFHLKEATWSDGTPITAQQFETSWKQILQPPAICAYLFYPIKNAERCVKGEATLSEVGIHAIDDKTLEVELEYPAPYFYSLTAFPSFLPAPPKAGLYNGPFVIGKTSHQNEIILLKNPQFRGEVALDEIRIHIVPDEMTALQMFEKGQLDWLGGPLSPLSPDAYEKVKDEIIYVPNAASTLCTFNTQTFPFQSQHLRKAFAYSINRDEIVTQVTLGGQISPESILPPSLSHHRCALFDPDLARQHMAAALQELQIPKEKLEELVLYYKQGQIERRIAQTIQRQWKETLGVEVQLIQLDSKSHMYRLQTKDFQVALSNWIAQFDDPISILERFKTKGQLKNYPGWENGQYIQLLDDSKYCHDRTAVLAMLEEILAQETPLTPVYHWRSPAIAGPRIKTMGTTPSGGILFERFELY